MCYSCSGCRSNGCAHSQLLKRHVRATPWDICLEPALPHNLDHVRSARVAWTTANGCPCPAGATQPACTAFSFLINASATAMHITDAKAPSTSRYWISAGDEVDGP